MAQNWPGQVSVLVKVACCQRSNPRTPVTSTNWPLVGLALAGTSSTRFRRSISRVAKVRIYEINDLPQIELLLGALDMGGGTKDRCLFHFDSADLRSLKSQQQSVEPEVELDDTRLLSPLLIREAVKYLHAMQATAGSALLFNQFDATKAELVATIGANPKELRRIVSSAASQQRVAGRISLSGGG